MQLIILAGLPGTGKSRIAEAIGRRLSIPVLSKDRLEATLVRCGYHPASADQPALGSLGYALMTTLLEDHLSLGQSAIADSVASTETIRQEWRTLAATYHAQWRVIECVCSDATRHRERLLVRERGIPGWPELAWSDVERVAAYYAPWNEERLILDSVNGISENITSAVAYLATS